MPTDELIARLNAGGQGMGQGSGGVPKLTNMEIAVAAGFVRNSFDHALMMSKQGVGVGGYTRGLTFESLWDGTERVSWDLWRERKRQGKYTVQINRSIAELALEEFMDPEKYRERSQHARARHAGVSRAHWFRFLAIHFADLLGDLHTREQRAYAIVRRQLREDRDDGADPGTGDPTSRRRARRADD